LCCCVEPTVGASTTIQKTFTRLRTALHQSVSFWISFTSPRMLFPAPSSAYPSDRRHRDYRFTTPNSSIPSPMTNIKVIKSPG
jgi:hypothetical protein